MSKRVDITVSDVVYDAIMAEGARKGHANDRDGGRRVIVTECLQDALSKRSYPIAILRLPDDSYAELGKKILSTRVERV